MAEWITGSPPAYKSTSAQNGITQLNNVINSIKDKINEDTRYHISPVESGLTQSEINALQSLHFEADTSFVYGTHKIKQRDLYLHINNLNSDRVHLTQTEKNGITNHINTENIHFDDGTQKTATVDHPTEATVHFDEDSGAGNITKSEAVEGYTKAMSSVQLQPSTSSMPGSVQSQDITGLVQITGFGYREPDSSLSLKNSVSDWLEYAGGNYIVPRKVVEALISQSVMASNSNSSKGQLSLRITSSAFGGAVVTGFMTYYIFFAMRPNTDINLDYIIGNWTNATASRTMAIFHKKSDGTYGKITDIVLANNSDPYDVIGKLVGVTLVANEDYAFACNFLVTDNFINDMVISTR
jgi:hypothetical protein